jgi:hypothetical protein
VGEVKNQFFDIDFNTSTDFGVSANFGINNDFSISHHHHQDFQFWQSNGVDYKQIQFDRQ